MKKVVEVEDTLEENVQDAIDEIKNLVESYLDDNPDSEEAPDLYNDLDYDGRFHEIVDSAVPIYTSEIEDTWYLYASELEEAYENAGVGDNPRENNGMAAIYYYIEQKVAEWYEDTKEDLFEGWKRRHQRDGSRGTACSED